MLLSRYRSYCHHAILLIICAFRRLYKVYLQIPLITLASAFINSISRILYYAFIRCFQQFYIRFLPYVCFWFYVSRHTFVVYLGGFLRLSAFIWSLASGVIVMFSCSFQQFYIRYFHLCCDLSFRLRQFYILNLLL